MRNLSVGVKLYFLVCCFIASLTLVGGTGWLGIRNAGSAMEGVSKALVSVNALASLRRAQLISIVAMQEGANWRPEIFEQMKDKEDAIAEAQSLFSDIILRHRSSVQQAERAYQEYDAQPKTLEEQALWKDFTLRWQDFRAADEAQTQICESLANSKTWGDVRARYQSLVSYTPAWIASIHAMGESLGSLVTLSVEAAEGAQLFGESFIVTTKTLMFSIFAAAILILGGLAALIVRSVVVPLKRLRTSIERVGATNDFSIRADSFGRDEVAQAASVFNLLLERMQGALLMVMAGAGKVDEASTQTNAVAVRVVSNATMQREAATEIFSTIEQISTAIGQINSSTQSVHACALDATVAAKLGAETISRTFQEADQVGLQICMASETISALGEESRRISTIVQVITDVSEQTNLLALNAAIEAARAGDQGRGFAVVADEVRHLARRTRCSAEEIKDMVSAMQASTQKAVIDMAGVAERTKESRAISEKAAENMTKILSSANLVSDLISEVSLALAEQNRTTEAISRRVEAVAQMNAVNCETGQHAANVSKDLNGAASNLLLAVNQFTV